MMDHFYLMMPRLFVLLILPTVLGCHPGKNPSGQTLLVSQKEGNPFAEYWFAGEAEVNSYAVEQFRYGETRKGEAVMVFVTEDFSKSKQVKLDDPDDAGKDKVPVLKLNNIRRFVTGIYDYSIMQSVFTPVDFKQYPNSLKTTTTSQDWCGHTFTQFNLQGDDYSIEQRSYFESEGDEDFELNASLLEDELWNKIRLNPESLVSENTNVIPSAVYARLLHQPLKPKAARIQIKKQESMSFLVLEYLHLDRSLTIGFEPEFPYKILTWTEQQDGQILSKGTLKESIKSAYWKKHDNDSEFLRDSLRIVW